MAQGLIVCVYGAVQIAAWHRNCHEEAAVPQQAQHTMMPLKKGLRSLVKVQGFSVQVQAKLSTCTYVLRKIHYLKVTTTTLRNVICNDLNLQLSERSISRHK